MLRRHLPAAGYYNSTQWPAHPLCTGKYGSGAPGGRPISIHLHGEQSLSPYDGWAEDEICGGESKDYVYPSAGAATTW